MIDHEKMTMRDRVHLPASPECGRWETMLVDALDGQLTAEDAAVFESHQMGCAACAALYEQAQCGQQWLAFLEVEPEPPAGLVDRILRETVLGRAHGREMAFAGRGGVPGGVDGGVLAPPWQRVGRGPGRGMLASLRRLAEPRLMMTAAMAFFSIALTLSLTGVQIRGVRAADSHTTSMRAALEKRIMTASTPVIRYYDHLRFVYEVESRMREMQHTTDNEQPDRQESAPRGKSTNHRGDGGSQLAPDGGGQRDPRQAPQQTVNPPLPLGGDEMLEARLEQGSRLEQPTEFTGNGVGKFCETSQAPEGSTICSA